MGENFTKSNSNKNNGVFFKSILGASIVLFFVCLIILCLNNSAIIWNEISTKANVLYGVLGGFSGVSTIVALLVQQLKNNKYKEAFETIDGVIKKISSTKTQSKDKKK